MTPSGLHLSARRLFVTSRLRYHARHGLFPVEIRSNVGLGARLAWCLEVIAYCDERNLAPYFRFSYPSSPRSADYFSPFFQIKGSDDRPRSFATVSSIIELDLGQDYDRVLTTELAHYLITKYLVVREAVVREVSDFCAQHFRGGRVLGVHYRGTDKTIESPPVPYGTVKRNIDRYLELYPDTGTIFIATDDADFLESIEGEFVRPAVVFRDDSVRSADTTSVHRSEQTDKYEVTRDALVNCLVLSRCHALLKTSSILSDWSKLFNPALPIIVLNRRYGEHLWFPEREFVKQSLFEPVA
jgi:hypothetical protein